MKLKRMNEALSILNSDGNILIIREHANNGKPKIHTNKYYIECLINDSNNKLCTGLNLESLFLFFKNEITLKELFLANKDKPFYLYRKGTGNDQVYVIRYQDNEALFNTLNCGDKKYAQLSNEGNGIYFDTLGNRAKDDTKKDIVILNGEGNLLYIKEIILHPKAKNPTKEYFLMGLLSDNSGDIGTPLNILSLISFFKDEITVKELFLANKLQPYIIYSDGYVQNTINSTDDTKMFEGVFEDIFLGNRYYKDYAVTEKYFCLTKKNVRSNIRMVDFL